MTETKETKMDLTDDGGTDQTWSPVKKNDTTPQLDKKPISVGAERNLFVEIACARAENAVHANPEILLLEAELQVRQKNVQGWNILERDPDGKTTVVPAQNRKSYAQIAQLNRRK